MLACENCGHVFNEEDAIRETEYTGVISEGYHESFDVTRCPECGDDWVEEACRCEFCGKWSANFVCQECKDLITVYLRRLIEHGMSMQRMNGIKPDRISVMNAISEIFEDMD